MTKTPAMFGSCLLITIHSLKEDNYIPFYPHSENNWSITNSLTAKFIGLEFLP